MREDHLVRAEPWDPVLKAEVDESNSGFDEYQQEKKKRKAGLESTPKTIIEGQPTSKQTNRATISELQFAPSSGSRLGVGIVPNASLS